MNEYYISPRDGMDCVVKFNRLNTYVAGDYKQESAYIMDLNFLKVSDKIIVNKSRSAWRLAESEDSRLSFYMLVKQNNIFRFESDEEALLFQEVME